MSLAIVHMGGTGVVPDLPARAAEGPYRRAGSTYVDILRAWTMAAALAGLWGVAVFGSGAAVVLIVAMTTAGGVDVGLCLLLGRPVIGGAWHGCLTGLLLGLMLPATVPWYVPAIGSAVAISMGKAMFGGLGRYVWQPALVGRVVVQFLFSSALSGLGPQAAGPVLARGHLLSGNLAEAQAPEPYAYAGWFETRVAPDRSALLIEPPVRALRRFAEGQIRPEDSLILTPLLRDVLPPWRDMLFGVVPGGIGETCTLALAVAGLYLIYRGFLRWQLPVVILATAALAAAVLPVEIIGGRGGYRWLPGLAVEEGRLVGLAYVVAHLVSGQLMLGAFLLAGDMVSSPLRVRGQVIYGAAIGVLTIFMRLYGVVDGECCWAILMVNPLVAVIDRRLPRPVVGVPA
jgi:electron transport complex protein RnfD